MDAEDDARDDLTRETAWRALPGTQTTDGRGPLRTAWGDVDLRRPIAPGTTLQIKGVTTHDAWGERA